MVFTEFVNPEFHMVNILVKKIYKATYINVSSNVLNDLVIKYFRFGISQKIQDAKLKCSTVTQSVSDYCMLFFFLQAKLALF